MLPPNGRGCVNSAASHLARRYSFWAIASKKASDLTKGEKRLTCFEDELCFAAYTLSHAFTRRYRLALKNTGLTYPRYLALLTLQRLENPTATQVAEALKMEFGTLTPMLKGLQREGLIVRSRTDSDERIVRVQLTAAGSALAERVSGLMAEVGEATGETSKSLALIVAELNKIRDRLEASSQALEKAGRP